MTTIHDPRHGLLLQALVAGDSNEAAAEIEACPICGDVLREMRATAAALDAAGVEQRAVLSAADALRAKGGDALVPADVVRALVRNHLVGGTQPKPPAHRPRWHWVVAAAALVLVGFFGARFVADEQNNHQPNVLLSTTTDPAPNDVEIRGDHCPFVCPGVPGEKFRLYLYDQPDAIEPWDTHECSNEWSPDADYVRKMRERSAKWSWRYERVSEQAPGSPSVGGGGPYYFSFSR